MNKKVLLIKTFFSLQIQIQIRLFQSMGKTPSTQTNIRRLLKYQIQLVNGKHPKNFKETKGHFVNILQYQKEKSGE